MITLKDVEKAYENIKDSVKKTPLMECPTLDEIVEAKVLLKLENLQRTGSFKVRGAINKIMNLSDEEKAKGVIASSAGNHAQGVALGAKAANIKATIVMPANAPVSKVSATKSYGARIVQHGDYYDLAYQKALEIQAAEGLTFVHPFNDNYTMAGQGTIALEILEEAPDIDAIFVQVGGGGLISGIAVAAKSINPKIKIYAVEAEGAASLKTSIEKGELVTLEKCKTIADGIAVARIGDLPFEVAKEYIDEVITVTENEIAKSILFLLEKSKVVAEGAGATALAGLLSAKIDIKGKKICCIVSGGNIDVNNIEKIVNRAQILEGRRLRFSVNLTDVIGEVDKITEILKAQKVNILYLNQSRYALDLDINEQKLTVVVECMDKNHSLETIDVIKKAGFKVITE